ncbi:hypothetical protein [Chryseobacterium indologenes]|uniref:Uncharacterized protein n=1 Tax=Chryseobacterium indologenes TaxID=253 RepID=A0A0N0IW15_CHRID|nr:hypothetical protein [Chryseobacterium indologenes]KPE51003.1 hypothetical protein AOB46_12505 [Chryseobacterium indologenes]
MNSTIKIKTGKCLDCPSDAPYRPLIAKRCQAHYKAYRIKVNSEKRPKEIKIRKPIRKVSKKQAIIDAKYIAAKIQFMGKIENKICPVTGQETTDVHHKMGRIGFADQWARINNVPLLLDSRFWLAVSREGHRQIEENPTWAKEMGYSLNRLTN